MRSSTAAAALAAVALLSLSTAHAQSNLNRSERPPFALESKRLPSGDRSTLERNDREPVS